MYFNMLNMKRLRKNSGSKSFALRVQGTENTDPDVWNEYHCNYSSKDGCVEELK